MRLTNSFSSQRRHAAEIRLKKELIRNHIYTLQSSRRKFSTSCALSHGHIDPPKPGEEYVRKESTALGHTITVYFHRLHVTFIDKDGGKHEFEVAKGDNLLDIAQANDIEMEGTPLWLTASARAN